MFKEILISNSYTLLMQVNDIDNEWVVLLQYHSWQHCYTKGHRSS